MDPARKIKELTLEREHLLTQLQRKSAEIIAAVHDCSTDSGILQKTPDDFTQVETDVSQLRLVHRQLVKINRSISELAKAL